VLHKFDATNVVYVTSEFPPPVKPQRWQQLIPCVVFVVLLTVHCVQAVLTEHCPKQHWQIVMPSYLINIAWTRINAVFAGSCCSLQHPDSQVLNVIPMQINASSWVQHLHPLGCDTVSQGLCVLVFWRFMVPSRLGVKQSKKVLFWTCSPVTQPHVVEYLNLQQNWWRNLKPMLHCLLYVVTAVLYLQHQMRTYCS
jgi:hypothetical protein